MNIYNKYNLTKEQNIALARRNVIESIYKSAKLEGIAVTFPQTKKALRLLHWSLE